MGEYFATPAAPASCAEIEDSLRRLRTDYIDIYQVHWPDPLVTIEETAEAMHTLFRQGKIRAIGVSNFSVGQMERFRRVAPLHVLQPPYNLFERGIEADLLPYCRKNKIATLGYGALCRGLLSGRMRPDTVFDGDDLRRTDPKFREPRFAQYLTAVQRLDRLAKERFGKRVIQLAVRWMLDQGVTTALWGARHPDQLQPVDEVTGWRLDAAAKAEIDRILRETITDPVGPGIHGSAGAQRRSVTRGCDRGYPGSELLRNCSRRKMIVPLDPQRSPRSVSGRSSAGGLATMIVSYHGRARVDHHIFANR